MKIGIYHLTKKEMVVIPIKKIIATTTNIKESHKQKLYDIIDHVIKDEGRKGIRYEHFV